MRCPECGIECRVQLVGDTIHFYCRNKKCRQYQKPGEAPGKEVAAKTVKKPE